MIFDINMTEVNNRAKVSYGHISPYPTVEKLSITKYAAVI